MCCTSCCVVTRRYSPQLHKLLTTFFIHQNTSKWLLFVSDEVTIVNLLDHFHREVNSHNDNCLYGNMSLWYSDSDLSRPTLNFLTDTPIIFTTRGRCGQLGGVLCSDKSLQHSSEQSSKQFKFCSYSYASFLGFITRYLILISS